MSFVSTTTALRFDVVQQADALHIKQIIDFVMASRQIMFPMLDHQVLPDDLFCFRQTFIEHSLGCFICAYDEKSKLAAVAGFREYDHRFNHLFHLQPQTTVELVKLYVLPEYRRQGVASELVRQLKQQAQQQGVGQIYLHTHPFLAGAKDFWLSHQFNVLQQDKDPVWQTIHMNLRLSLLH